MKDRRARSNRRFGVEHGVQDLVLHLNQPQGFGRDVRRGRSHGRHRVTVVERGVPRHNVHGLQADGVAEGLRAFDGRHRNVG